MRFKPSEIRYSQDSISCTFTGRHWGKKIGKTLDNLVDGKISVDDIPRISVIFRNEKWFTCDNRRLWVFKHFELLGGSTHISATETTYLNISKLTTDNEGTAIRVRGSPGGTWYSKYSQNPTKYRNYLRNPNFNPYSDPPAHTASSDAEYFRSGLPTRSYQSSLQMQATNYCRYDKELTEIRNNTETTRALFGFQQQPIVRYQSTDYTTEMISRSTSMTTKLAINSSLLPLSNYQIIQQSSSSITETQRPISETSVKETRQVSDVSSSDSTEVALGTRTYLVSDAGIAAQPVHKSAPSTFTTGVISIQNVSDRTKTSVPTSKATLTSSLHQTYLLSTPEDSLRNSRLASTLLGSNSSGKNYLVPNEIGISLVNQRSNKHMTSSSEKEPASKKRKYSFVTKPVGSFDRNKSADISRPSFGSSMSAMRTANIKGRALKTASKVKPASRQLFATNITVIQNQYHRKTPALVMLDISKIRYTKDAIEYPLSDDRQSEVQRRLQDLLQASNPKPLEVYKAYDLYWLKEENDVLWTLLNIMQDRLVWGQTSHKVKALVTEDNDAFLDFMRKEKPWLQICDILQLGQNIEIIE
ncbi:hypothetical protein CHS0354_028508 [Potamilus streckersoni]|uniref:Uncharacterized protein n=1 Tax=Potamilus streckersoni TaxID=2493646 RepID=A0AAE0VTU0_9BIVA|nr:hypothetical protein CHS0354_028508 [Potamilus streckersoni]